MKRLNYISILFLACFSVVPFIGSAQALLSTDDSMNDVEASAMLQVYSTDRGLLVPTVMLTENEGKIVAPTISNNPADGLIIFHDGRNNIGKGLL